MPRQVRLLEPGPGAGPAREIAVAKEEFLIGRAPDSDLRLLSAGISRHHCLLRLSEDEVTLIDLGSSNGTYLNGQRVRSQAVLKTGDQIQLDQAHFLVDLGDGGAPDWGVAGTDPLATTQRRAPDRPPTAP